MCQKYIYINVGLNSPLKPELSELEKTGVIVRIKFFFCFPEKCHFHHQRPAENLAKKKYKSQVLEVQFKVFTLNCLVPTHAR